MYHSNSNQNEYWYVIFILYGNGIILLGISCRLILNEKKLTFNFNHFGFFSFNLGYLKNCLKILSWQCLLHRPGVQHLIAAAPAAPLFLFCCSIYYLSSWHHCPNPNSNRKVLEKKKNYISSEVAL